MVLRIFDLAVMNGDAPGYELVAKVAHGGKEQHQADFVLADVGGFFMHLSHADGVI